MDHCSRGGAQREAQTDLPCSLRHEVRHDAVDPYPSGEVRLEDGVTA
jgi:hypothetical protein